MATAPRTPLLAPQPMALTRTYVAFGITTRGRQGAAVAAADVPLVPAPPTPSTPAVTYDETAVTLTWPRDRRASRGCATGGRRRAAVDATRRTRADHRLQRLRRDQRRIAGEADGRADRRSHVCRQPRSTWGRTGATRCGPVETIGALHDRERRAGTALRDVLTDTFRAGGAARCPGASERRRDQSDLGARAPRKIWPATSCCAPRRRASTLEPLTPAPIQETLFKDEVPRGVSVRLHREGRGPRRQHQPGIGARDRDRALTANVVAQIQADRDGPA